MRWMLLLIACNNLPLPTVKPGRPPSGVYQVTSTLTGNDCSLQPVPHGGTVPVTVTDEWVFAPLPSGTLGLESMEVPWDGLAAELDYCRARRSMLFEVTRFDDNDLVLRRTTSWRGTDDSVPGCAPASDC